MGRQASASRRIANVLLSVVLVLGLMPASALAKGASNTDAIEGSVPSTSAAQVSATADTVDVSADTESDDSVVDALAVNGTSSDGGAAFKYSETEATLTPGWAQSGTCEWNIDAAGNLIIRPLGGRESGTLRDWVTDRADIPWSHRSASIKSVTVKPGVAAKACNRMFSDCSSLETLDLSGLDTSQVTSMSYMFSDCSSLESIDLSGLNTSKVKSADHMLYGCSNLKSIDLSGLDTSQVTNMGSMFAWCSSLETLDLSGFDTSRVTSMDSMFYNCASLKTIYASKSFTTAKVESPSNTFYQCAFLVGGAGTAYDPAIINASRARIDLGANAPGYFTGKHEKLDGDINGNGVLSVVDAQIVYDIATTGLYKDRQDYADMRARADVTWDNEVDATDAFAIQYAALRSW